ncbi:MAG: general secretion pathway protein GspK, partial [Halioglobus sp.]|nr:general secretion pathway protein GspK [Halioglobus sp.]
AGLVDINLAPGELLSRVFAAVENIEEAEALILAANVVEWRSVVEGEASADTGEIEVRGESAMRHARFEAIEDLLLVPGVDRRIFEAVREAVYVSQSGQAGVDWQAAPPAVLKAVGGLTDEQVQELAERDAGDGIAPAELDLAFQQRESLPLYRADARVEAGGQTYLRRRWVERGSPGVDRLPWRFFRTEPVRAVGLTVQAASSESGND